jgi:glycosyltransferase involved in cell wall biosynthesis
LTAHDVEPRPVTIVVPAYNEEAGIGPLLRDIQAVMDHTNIPYQLLVVDDGSTDGTAAAALAPGVGAEVVQHPENRGYGASLKTGIRRARHDLIVITDADGTYPSARIPDLVTDMAYYDMVVGARVGNQVEIPLARRPAKWAINQLANWMAGTRIPDLNSGLRAFRKEMAQQFLRILPDGFSFTTTITLATLERGYKVKYVPIDYHRRAGRSKIRPIYDTLNFIQLIIRTTMYFAPLRIFLPVALLLLLVALGIMVYSKIVLGQLMDVTVVVTFLASLQIAMAGLLADLVDKRSPRL